MRYRCLSYTNPCFRRQNRIPCHRTHTCELLLVAERLRGYPNQFVNQGPPTRGQLLSYLYILPFSIVLVESGAFGERGMLAMAFAAVEEEGVE